MAVLPKPYIVRCRNNSTSIQESVVLLKPGFIQPPLTEWSIFPKRAPVYRVDLEVVETPELESCHFCRKANLAELLLFGRRFPDFFYEFDGIEGFDEHLERHGTIIKSSLTVPYICMHKGKIAIKLRRFDRFPHQPYTLVVKAMRLVKR